MSAEWERVALRRAGWTHSGLIPRLLRTRFWSSNTRFSSGLSLMLPPVHDLTVAALAASVLTAKTPASTIAAKTAAAKTKPACLVTMETPSKTLTSTVAAASRPFVPPRAAVLGAWYKHETWLALAYEVLRPGPTRGARYRGHQHSTKSRGQRGRLSCRGNAK